MSGITDERWQEKIEPHFVGPFDNKTRFFPTDMEVELYEEARRLRAEYSILLSAAVGKTARKT